MSLISILILALLLPCIAGGISTLLWIGIHGIYGKWGNARYLYILLRCTIFGFQLPFIYLAWYILRGIDTGRYSSLALISQKMKIIMYVFLLIWGIGILLSGIRRIHSRRYFRRIKKTCIPASGEEQRILKRICEELGIKRKIFLYDGYAVRSPFVCGIFKPCIYLPVRHFSSEDLEMILYHELMHYKQKDILWKPMFALVSFVYWFDPLTGYLWRLMRKWAEASCDAACCERRFSAKKYFSLLLNINTMELYQNSVHFASMWCENNQELKWRIACIRKFKQRSRRLPIVAALVILSLMISSVSTKAAVDGAGRICEQVFWKTIDRRKESGQYLHELDSILESQISLQEKGWTLRNTRDMEGTLQSGEIYMLPELQFDSETEVYVYGHITPPNKEVMVEFLKDGQTAQYLVMRNSISHFFYGETEGKYRLMIRNISNEEITFNGYMYLQHGQQRQTWE